MALELALADKEDVKVVLEITPTETKYDSLIEGIINGVSLTFQVTTGRGILEQAQVDYFDMETYTERLYVHRWPIDAILDLNLYYDRDREWGEDTLVDPSDYFIDYEEGEIELLTSFQVGKRVFKLTYTGGMATTTANFKTLYPDIQQAVVAQCVFQYQAIPNLGVNLVRLRQDAIEVTKPLNRIPLFDIAAVNNSRVIV